MPALTGDGLSVTHLDHDHRKRENIRCFAIYPLFAEDLRRSPSCGVITVIRSTSDGIWVFSNRGETKICNPRVASGVYKDI